MCFMDLITRWSDPQSKIKLLGSICSYSADSKHRLEIRKHMQTSGWLLAPNTPRGSNTLPYFSSLLTACLHCNEDQDI